MLSLITDLMLRGLGKNRKKQQGKSLISDSLL